MTGQETAQFISTLERELPSRRNDELSDRERKERLILWGAALRDVDYMTVMRKMPLFLSTLKWFPRLHEVLERMKPDPLNEEAKLAAEYRRMFSDWMHDGLNNGQRMERMEKAKLAAAQGLVIEEAKS